MTDRVNCDEIYGLFFIDPCCNLNQYICAVSLDKRVLNIILDKEVKNDEKKYHVIKKVKYYSLDLIDNKIIITKKQSMNKHKFDKSLYAFNKIITKDNYQICEQVLLNINEKLNINDVRCFSLFKDNISYSQIYLGEYYFESIMNS